MEFGRESKKKEISSVHLRKIKSNTRKFFVFQGHFLPYYLNKIQSKQFFRKKSVTETEDHCYIAVS